MVASPPRTPEQHQAEAATLAEMVAEAIRQLWAALIGQTLTEAAFKAGVIREVQAGARAQAALTARQYQRQRTAAGVVGDTFKVRTAPPPATADIEQMVNEALASRSKNSSADVGEKLARDAEGEAFDTGVRTILSNADRDRKARGYARIPEAGACAFCLLLATRGAVYKAERSRGRGDSFTASNAKFTDHPDALPSSIKVHDNCRCQPEPVWGVYEAPARVREAEATYIAASKKGGGRKAVTIRFRQMVEGRYHPDDDE